MKISIITATYNSGKTIGTMLDSVLRQDYDDYECIVVDGLSKDNTMDVVRGYEPRFNGRMTIVSEKDNGIYDAMNKGLALATGDVVGFLNSDDHYTSNDVLSKLVPYFDDEKLDAVYGDIHFVREGAPEKCVRYYSSRKFRPMWLRFGFMPAHPSFYARKRVYEKSGGYKTDYEIGADYEMMVRLFLKHKISAKYVPMDFVTMLTGGASNRNLHSRMVLVKEDVRACRENDVYTNMAMISVKFIYKLFGLRF